MNKLIRYTLNRIGQKLCSSEDLDNRNALLSQMEREEEMAANSKKIRRQVELNGVKIWVTADTEQEYAEKVVKLASGVSNMAGKEKRNFKEYAENWFTVFSKPNVENVTALSYERQLIKHILPVLGDKNLEEITPADVQRIFNEMPEDAKQETKNKTKSVLNQIFNMAIDDGYILRNPLQASSIRVKGIAATETEPYSVEQMRYLAAHLDELTKPMDKAWLALSISLPLRPEEVLGLLWEDIDERNGILHVRNTVTHPDRNQPEFKTYTKTAASIRDLAIPQEVLERLPERGTPKDFVIGGKTPLTYTQLRGVRKRINFQLHFGETITPRRFRTTVATDISAMTHDLKLVQKMLGHATPQMTLKHYDKGRSVAVDARNAIQQCYGLAQN